MATGWVDYDDQVDVAHQGEGGEGDLGAFPFQVVLQCSLGEDSRAKLLGVLDQNEEHHTLLLSKI